MAASSTITLENSMQWAKKFTFLRPSAQGNALEPAVTCANLVLLAMLSAPFYWRWNRVVTGFVTKVGQQDYTLFNWTATTAVTTAFVLVDSNGNCQAVTTAGTTGSTIPSFNATKGQTTTDGSVIWTNMGSIGTPVSTTYELLWIERANFQYTNPNNSEQLVWREMKPKITLALDSAESQPSNIAAEMDDGKGNVTFRLMPVPDGAYPVAITLQEKPTLFSANTEGINQTWAPIPDEYSHIYSWGFLALMLLYADDPRFTLANQKFVTSILSIHQGLSETEINIWLNNWNAITGQQMVKDGQISQGLRSREV